MMVSLAGPALFLLLVIICIFSTIQEVDAFLDTVPPSSSSYSFRHATPPCSSSNIGWRTETKKSSLHATSLDFATSSGIVESMKISALTFGDTFAGDAPGASDLGVILGGVLTAVVFTVAQFLLIDATTQTTEEDTIKEDNDKVTASSFESSSRRVRKSRHNVGLLGRRSTLTTLIGGAIGFAASDMILGAASNILIGGGGTTAATAAVSSSSSVYGARWNALFQRIATASAKHEAAIASPELVSWISKSPAALANPELRAWIAAQRAFHKGRQTALAAAVVVEEGMAAVTATRAVATAAAAAAATQQKSGANDSNNNNVYNDDDVVDHFDTSLPNSGGAVTATSTTSFKAKSEDSSELLTSPVALSASTGAALAESDSDLETSNGTLNNKEDEE